MIKVKNIILDILIEKAIFTKKIQIGTSIVDIDVSEIIDIMAFSKINKSKSSINKALSELKKEGIISFDSSERSKIRQICIENILFYSIKNDDCIEFGFDDFYINQFLDSLESSNGISLDKNISNANLFNDCFENMKLYAYNYKSNIKFLSNENNKFAQFIVVGVDEENIDINLYGKNSFLMGLKNSAPLSHDFPQILRNFRSFCGKSKLMYVLYNNLIYSSFIEYSTLYSVFPQNLRKFRSLDKRVLFDHKKQENVEIGKLKMSSSSFIEKTKENYKKTSGSNLFDDSQNSWKNIAEEKRDFRKMPICAYKAFEWVSFVSDLYEKNAGKTYPRTRNSEAIALVNKVYPKIFNELKWSAEDFKLYVEKSLGPGANQKSKEHFILGFLASNEIRIKDIEEFTKERKIIRKNDYFENLIYIPHIPILSEEEISNSPLDKIISSNINSEAAIIYNYGICNYHRYLQLSGLSIDQATLKIISFIKNEIIENIFKKDKDIAIRYIDGIARNTILWEPYSENDSCRPARNVLDWRKVFVKLWKNKDVDSTIQDWWTKYPNYEIQVLPSVKKFFSSTKKSIEE